MLDFVQPIFCPKNVCFLCLLHIFKSSIKVLSMMVKIWPLVQKIECRQGFFPSYMTLVTLKIRSMSLKATDDNSCSPPDDVYVPA